jgi:hypothetical protein
MNIAEYLLSIWGPTGFNSCSFLTTAIIESSYDKLVWLVEKAGFWFGLLNTFDYEMVASALASRGEVKVVQFFVKHGFDFSFDMCFWSMCVKTNAFEVMDYIEYIRNECPYLMERDRKRYDTWKKLRNQVKIKAVNKIYFWWGPILRRINPGFVLREAEESYEKLRTTFLQG